MLKSVSQFPEIINLDNSLLPSDWMKEAVLVGNRADMGSMELIRADSTHFKDAIRVGSRLNFHEEKEIRVDIPSASPVSAGDIVRLRFWFRCTESLCGDGYIFARILREQDPDNALTELNISAAGDWTECVLACEIPENLDIGQLVFSLQGGFEMQFIEIGGVQAINLKGTVPLALIETTVVTYPGRSSDAGWRELAMQRIEEHRKSNLHINITDKHGKAIHGANVQIEQVEQEFGFGTCVAASLLLGSGHDSQQYRDKVSTMFNRAVFENDMKWQASGEGMTPEVLQAIDWLQERGISVRGHNMIWPSWRWLPDVLRSLSDDPTALGLRVMNHIKEISKYYQGKLTDWDVVNEPFSNHDLMDALGGNDVMVDWYKAARAANPDCLLCLNDFGILEGGRLNHHRNHFHHTIQQMLAKGAPIDTIGIQSHFGTNLPSPIRLLEVLDQFSEFGLPLESTEISLNLTDRQLQADYLGDYVTALYSHANVKGVMLWGFWSERHWRPDAALFDRDWEARPVAQAWIDTRKRFTTSLITKTDSSGQAECRAFHGRYNISIQIDNSKTRKTVTVSKEDKTLNIQII